MKVLRFFFLVLCIGLTLTGCTSSLMQPVSTDPTLSYSPAAHEAVVIFMRPSMFGGAIQSAVFDVTTEENVLVGIVSAKSKVAYKTIPGDHLFMVVGESADFMKAELGAGKTYYALVTPRMGLWKARFSLKPIKRGELETKQFTDWESSCSFYENTAKSHQWVNENLSSIQSKREADYKKWMSKPEANRPVLREDDGR